MSRGPAKLPEGDRTPHPASVVRRYAANGGPAEPAELFGRIASAGIRLRCDSGDLLAEVPEATIRDRGWPALDRRLERHAGSLALTVDLTRRFAAGRPPKRVAAMLAELRDEVPEILLDTVGGAERLSELIASPPLGADFDLACVACCRGLAIRVIQHGRGWPECSSAGRAIPKSEPAAGTRERSAWLELEAWARKLGGRLVAAGSVT